MDGTAFDRMVQRLHAAAGRRSVLAGLTAAGLAVGVLADPASAKKKKKKKKTVTVCRNGQTISVPAKKRQPGDTTGPCPTTTLRPTTTRPPRCPVPRPNYCARFDSCQPSCSAGHAFDPETCACLCAPANTCCYCNCQSRPVSCFPDGIADEVACIAQCASSCQEAPGTVAYSFAGGEGSGTTCDFTNDRCNVTCTAEGMLCPAGFSPSVCSTGLTCCAPEDGGGCCPVDTPLCCGDACCPADTSCCQNDGDCEVGQSCVIVGGADGCCVDTP